MEDCREIDSQMGGGVSYCKNLFLCNRQMTEFYLLLIGIDKKFRTAEVSKQIGASRLSFGASEKLSELLGEKPGAVSPLGLLFDKRKAITVLIDSDVTAQKRVCVHPCVNTASVILSSDDLIKYIRACGNDIKYVTIAAD
ncbi:Prolyl-tRNA editing protein ProX [bioreactor metagenome]|uniref:Prolyl-tRNA editing protein ProX n=1 Tax=bioreactor metagenome TaxID=1076179 RepID=A0A645DUZ5_9ZZZZ